MSSTYLPTCWKQKMLILNFMSPVLSQCIARRKHRIRLELRFLPLSSILSASLLLHRKHCQLILACHRLFWVFFTLDLAARSHPNTTFCLPALMSVHDEWQTCRKCCPFALYFWYRSQVRVEAGIYSFAGSHKVP